jgi:hypothetical protein
LMNASAQNRTTIRAQTLGGRAIKVRAGFSATVPKSGAAVPEWDAQTAPPRTVPEFCDGIMKAACRKWRARPIHHATNKRVRPGRVVPAF